MPVFSEGAAHSRRELIGLAEGLLAVFLFSLTLPLSRYVVQEISPITTGFARSAIAGLLALPALFITRQRLPTRREWKGLAVVSLGIIYVFPIFVAWAMKYTPASHGSIVIGLLPLATAIAAAILGYDRPPRRFWAAAFAGSITVVGYALYHAGGAVHAADLALLLAVICSGVAYAEGGFLARSLGGWQVISWVSAMNLPIVLPILGYLLYNNGIHASEGAIAALIFMGIFPQYVAFFSWYKAMALAGVAKVSQLQLLQPFMTVVIAAIFMHEVVYWDTWLALIIVVSTVFIARRAAGTARRAPAPQE